MMFRPIAPRRPRRPRRLVALALALGVALAPALAPTAAPADQATETAAFTQALAAADAGKWDQATALAANAGMPAADVIEWERLRAAKGTLDDYVAFLARRPDWPGLSYLKKQGEAQLAGADPARVIAYFGTDHPRSAAGAIALVAAYDATGQTTKSQATALAAWTTLPFTADEEATLLAAHPELGRNGDLARLDMLLWDRGRSAEVRRLLPHVNAGLQKLALARLGLQANLDNARATALIRAVPSQLASDPGLAYDRFIWRMRHNLYPDATRLILASSTTAASLGSPSAWSGQRLSLARYLMRTGSPHNAYRVAASHHLRSSDSDYSDLEFLAGFIALRKLNDPATALTHFRKLPGSGSAISTTRRNYWIGRTYDALHKPAKAHAAYLAAANEQTAYYGLLAAEKLGMNFDPALLSRALPPTSLKDAGIAQSSVFEAAVQLALAHDEELSGRFIVHLCASLTTQQIGPLAGYSLKIGAIRNAVLAAKVAAWRGVIYPAAYYPIPDMVPGHLPVSRALALAVTRRESEFNPGAGSGAGAKGLMQLMPSTARQQAHLLGLPYSAGRLTSDPAYNVTLGSEYLKGLVDRFGPSLALIAVGYNAGPNRAASWVKAFGDPRGGVDPVDWIETIPFDETRTYTMRLTESVVIYRAMLKGVSAPVRITPELTGK